MAGVDEVAVPTLVDTETDPFCAPAPTRANSTESEPIVISPAGTPPIITLVIPPSLTKPEPLIVTTVPGHVPAAVTTCGTAAFPPTQLVIVTAPADPATTAVSAAKAETQSAVLPSETRVRALPLTSRASLRLNRLLRGLTPPCGFLPCADALCNAPGGLRPRRDQ